MITAPTRTPRIAAADDDPGTGCGHLQLVATSRRTTDTSAHRAKRASQHVHLQLALWTTSGSTARRSLTIAFLCDLRACAGAAEGVEGAG